MEEHSKCIIWFAKAAAWLIDVSPMTRVCPRWNTIPPNARLRDGIIIIRHILIQRPAHKPHKHYIYEYIHTYPFRVVNHWHTPYNRVYTCSLWGIYVMLVTYLTIIISIIIRLDGLVFCREGAIRKHGRLWLRPPPIKMSINCWFCDLWRSLVKTGNWGRHWSEIFLEIYMKRCAPLHWLCGICARNPGELLSIYNDGFGQRRNSINLKMFALRLVGFDINIINYL